LAVLQVPIRCDYYVGSLLGVSFGSLGLSANVFTYPHRLRVWNISFSMMERKGSLDKTFQFTAKQSSLYGQILSAKRHALLVSEGEKTIL
jgi:hypothetical protein